MPTKPRNKPKAPRQPGLCRHGDRAYTRIRGKWIPLGTWGTAESQVAYDKAIAEYLANGRRFSAPEPKAAEPALITVAEVLAAYWEHAEKKFGGRRSAEKTLGHIKQAMKPVRSLFGALPAKSFGPVALETVRETFVADGLSRKTVNERTRTGFITA